MGIKGVYPWGKGWPPPKGAGDYAEELKADKFEFTGPVGSFEANQFGLHDLGGNVWERCEDWYAPAAKKFRVLRGASWGNLSPGFLLSSRRVGNTPDKRSNSTGFRCVLMGE